MIANVSSTYHEEYTRRASQWMRCRDAKEGEDAVHYRAETYLPRLGDQDDAGYDSYKLRARWFNAFNKTISGYTGLVLRTPITLDAPEASDDLLNNIDRSGSNVEAYIKSVLKEVLEVGRCGTLVDYTAVEEGASKAQAKDARVYWALYKAEDILDWEYTEGRLTYVVLREHLSRKDPDYVLTDKLQRYRVLRLKDGVYTQDIFVEGEGIANTQQEDILLRTTTPKRNQAVLEEIPFIIHEPDFTQTVSPPPLIDLVNLNYSHYRLKADHAHALHYVALPTPYVIGVDPDDGNAPTSIGPQKLWLIGNEAASVGMLEFTGAGISAIQAELVSMEEQMAMLGARMLISEAQEKTATAAKIKSISETSDLAAVVVVLNTQFDTLLVTTLDWALIPGESSVSINRHFLPPDLDAQMILALIQGWQAGAYDYDTLVVNLQKGEIIDPHVDPGDLKSSVDTETAEKDAAEAEKMAQAVELEEKKAAAAAASGGEPEPIEKPKGNEKQ